MIVPPRNLSAMPRWGSTSRRRIRPSLLFSPNPIRDGDPKYLHRATIRICGQGGYAASPPTRAHSRLGRCLSRRRENAAPEPHAATSASRVTSKLGKPC